MRATTEKLPAEGTQHVPNAHPPHDPAGHLSRSIKDALGVYLGGRKLVRVKIRQVEGSKIEGFLKIEGRKGERFLVDFKAVSAPHGGLTSLQVGGKKLSLDEAAKRTH